MNRRVSLIAIAAVLLLGAFLLIMTELHSPEEALAPPSPNPEARELQQAFENVVGPGTGYRLQYPSEGDYRSAYVITDLDGDENEEALVFYTKISDESNVRVNILDYQDERWTSVLDESGYGNNIDSVTFSDLDADGTSEVILSWSLSGTESSRTMTVHSAKLDQSKPEFRTLANMPYKTMGIVDMDNDGQNEVLVLWTESAGKVTRNYASLMKMTKKGLQAYGDVTLLDSSVSLYDGVYVQNEKRPAVFVDALKGDGSMLTEVLWWDGDSQTLVDPFADDETGTNLRTLRSQPIPTFDVDGDGLYEIPVSYGAPESQSSGSDRNAEKEEERVYFTAWSQTGAADPGVLKPQSYSLVDSKNRFVFQIPDGFQDYLIAYRNTKTGVITVYNVKGGQRGDPMFSLVYSSKGKPKSSKEQYTFLKTQGNRAVYGSLTSAGAEEGFNDEGIQNSLVFY